MKKYIALLLLCIPLLYAFKGVGDKGTRKRLPSGCYVRYDEVATGISLLQTKCQLTFKTNDGYIITDSIKYSHNGTTGILKPDSNGVATVVLPYGSTRFQFLYTTFYYEIYSNPIELKGGHFVKIDVLFESSQVEIIEDKPVIYVYPDATKTVNIQLGVKGQLGFTYPQYYMGNPGDSATLGWSFSADHDGTIHMNGKEYDYLFWDAKQTINMNNVDMKKGFIVQRDSLVPFFEKQLTAMNLSPREQQDFITYWVPRMQVNEKSFVQFAFNEEYDQFATINVTPKPDHVFRVMMLWMDASSISHYPMPAAQIIPSVKRDGFTVIEWGGSEIQATKNLIIED